MTYLDSDMINLGFVLIIFGMNFIFCGLRLNQLGRGGCEDFTPICPRAGPELRQCGRPGWEGAVMKPTVRVEIHPDSPRVGMQPHGMLVSFAAHAKLRRR